MWNKIRKVLAVLVALSVLAGFTGCSDILELFDETEISYEAVGTLESLDEESITEDGRYTHCDDVAYYIHIYGHLPDNFITKEEARELGWEDGGLDDYMYGGCIGGNRFGNYEGLLNESEGREFWECDIDTMHQDERGAKRIVYSNDGLIYYTEDHYASFVLLYGEP